MALIEDDEPEAVTVARRVDVEAVVGGDGHRLHVVLAPAEHADVLDVEGGEQAVVPLVDEVEGGHHDEGGAVDEGDREVATKLLPAPVGRTTRPRLPAATQASIASRW